MRKNLLILAAFALLILLMSQTYKSNQRKTTCIVLNEYTKAERYIEEKSEEGFRVVTVSSFSETYNGRSRNYFFIVMER
ncbi:hypothetical protein [Emticicia sp. 21SJ11W-3]|uniref:hypothetical protein n=1 Tax=Emticicia sp. 21SJ11W-3 TaxID=2916755 RepID=UPI00209E58FF|nr:hypothetical protein [Emticicia sp. 21SJ11W-3]UTA66487.1 hypothetical protein MB380_12845 [Emticicia sp. 21SJ11W-3]